MKCDEFLEKLKTQYTMVRVLSNKNDCISFQLRSILIGKDIVVRKFKTPINAYEILKHIHCDNVSNILDTYICDDGQIVIEEFINGITVSDVLENGLYTYKGAKTIISGVCAGLQVLHNYNIVHRDIKPQNVMVSNDGTVKLIDFNASHIYSGSKDSDTVILGTIGYASPEQLGIAQSDTRTDIYAIGILINVMLTGCHPSEKMAKGKAAKVITKCTQINPDKRYQNLYDLLSEL